MAHDPIPELGWPAMVMDMDVAGLDPAEVPRDAPVSFDLAKGEDGLFSIVAVRGDGMDSAPAMPASMPETMTETAPETMPAAAPPITVSGIIDAVDASTGMATITHDPIMEIGMPGMTMGFALADTVDPAALVTGEPMTLTFARPDGMTMVLTGADPVAPPMEVSGRIYGLDPGAGIANITHGPMTEIGMPGMTMDFTIDPSVDAATLPQGEDVTLLLERNPDFTLTLVGIRAQAVTQ